MLSLAIFVKYGIIPLSALTRPQSTPKENMTPRGSSSFGRGTREDCVRFCSCIHFETFTHKWNTDYPMRQCPSQTNCFCCTFIHSTFVSRFLWPEGGMHRSWSCSFNQGVKKKTKTRATPSGQNQVQHLLSGSGGHQSVQILLNFRLNQYMSMFLTPLWSLRKLG